MNRYSVMTEGCGSGLNSVCNSLGKIIDAVVSGLEDDHKITIVKIPMGSNDDDPGIKTASELIGELG